MSRFSLVSATGMLGSGFRPESLHKALDLGAEMIGCDAGTTDGGPSYLATGTAAFSDAALKRDLDTMVTAGVRAGVPVLIGSAGMSGSDVGVDRVVRLVREIARERALTFRLGTIRCEIDKATAHRHLESGRSAPLVPSGPLTAADIDAAERIVAVAGVEPFQAALAQGAQVVISGRATDAAIFAALPLARGCNAGATWHMAKILECGAAAVAQRAAPDCMMATVDDAGFDVFPLRDDYRCTPQSVASHALYETADPLELIEPSGTLRLDDATYAAISERAVRVEGSRFEPAARHSNKIEGVRFEGYSAIVLGAIRDPFILAELDGWLARLEREVATRLAATLGEAKHRIVTRVYGRDGVMGAIEPARRVGGHEVAILWDAIAPTQATANSVATSLSHLALHLPIAKWRGLITGLALAFSPAHVPRGPVYAFHLNHVLYPDDPLALFRVAVEEV